MIPWFSVIPLSYATPANAAGGLSYYNFIRKPASDFGWDWGPAFAPAGIYGMVEIQAYSYAIMTGIFPPWILRLLCLQL